MSLRLVNSYNSDWTLWEVYKFNLRLIGLKLHKIRGSNGRAPDSPKFHFAVGNSSTQNNQNFKRSYEFYSRYNYNSILNFRQRSLFTKYCFGQLDEIRRDIKLCLIINDERVNEGYRRVYQNYIHKRNMSQCHILVIYSRNICSLFIM